MAFGLSGKKPDEMLKSTGPTLGGSGGEVSAVTSTAPAAPADPLEALRAQIAELETLAHLGGEHKAKWKAAREKLRDLENSAR